MDKALRNLIEFTGGTLPEAFQASPRCRRDSWDCPIVDGSQADMVLLTNSLQVAETFVRGEVAYRADGGV